MFIFNYKIKFIYHVKLGIEEPTHSMDWFRRLGSLMYVRLKCRFVAYPNSLGLCTCQPDMQREVWTGSFDFYKLKKQLRAVHPVCTFVLNYCAY